MWMFCILGDLYRDKAEWGTGGCTSIDVRGPLSIKSTATNG